MAGRSLFVSAATLMAGSTLLLTTACAGSDSRAFVSSNAPITAITHVRVIDGTGAPGKDDQTVVIEDGRIREIASAGSVQVPPNAKVIDGHGRTLIPGLVGMHEHLFYQMDAPSSGQMAFAAQEPFAKLYLASGVTTIRTAGTVDFAGDLRIKEQIDAGRVPGPKIHLTGPYLNAMSAAPDPEGIAREVGAQADRGATSFKAYTSLRSSELQAAIQAAHMRGLRITGHLCAVGFLEAASMGIDNLEHGLPFDTELYSQKQPDNCPDQGEVMSELAWRDVATDSDIHRTIAGLVRRGVAVTSTLAVLESFTGRESALDLRMPSVLAPRLRRTYDSAHAEWGDPASPRSRMWSAMLTKEMQFERLFVIAGGRLLAGVDPTGWGGIVAGYGDQRELELLVEAGLTPETAIRIATVNGADFLYEGDHIGSIARGIQADLVLVRGNPSVRIADVRNVDLVFKDGVAYDPAALVAAVQGTVGRYDILWRLLRWPFNIILLGLVMLLVARVTVDLRRRRRAMTPVLAS
jgi:imidazolonepropionase-like amidohydrolase